MDAPLLDRVAESLEYPGPSTAVSARAAARAADQSGDLARALEDLARYLDAAAPGAAEESYTVLFDLDPVCTLSLSYHLFGESYARGELLSGLAGELARAGIDPGRELPDFLPTLLRLHARLDPEADRRLLVEALLQPGLERMARALAGSRSPWAAVIQALAGWLGSMPDTAGAGAVAAAADGGSIHG